MPLTVQTEISNWHLPSGSGSATLRIMPPPFSRKWGKTKLKRIIWCKISSFQVCLCNIFYKVLLSLFLIRGPFSLHKLSVAQKLSMKEKKKVQSWTIHSLAISSCQKRKFLCKISQITKTKGLQCLYARKMPKSKK